MKAPSGIRSLVAKCFVIGVMLFSVSSSVLGQNLVVNGGFEDPPGIGTWVVFDPSYGPPGWTVADGTVEIVGLYWQAAEGNQSLDLNGIYEAIGTIYQDLPTVPGQRYKVRFAYAGNL